MFNLKEILSLFLIINSAYSSYSGPYLLWGVDKLENLQLPALEAIDEKTLITMYTEAKAVVVFLRNSTSKLDKNIFPKFKELISRYKWAYLPQSNLPAEPVDYNANVEIISLVGPPSQQDVELAALYKDSATIFGEGEVLGILANQADEGHFIYKREADESSITSTLAPVSTTESTTGQSMQENNIYNAKQGLIYTSSPPVLTLQKGNFTKELKKHAIAQDDTRTQANVYRLIIKFQTVSLRFRFDTGDYWSLTEVEVENGDDKYLLTPVGDPPSAPKGFSYSCSRPLVFKDGPNHLKFKDIQVQPLLPEDQNYFNDPFDCIGFMTVPIWSGIFVSAIILFGTSIGIIALMDIKTPNRFESNRNKQLTFTVQE